MDIKIVSKRIKNFKKYTDDGYIVIDVTSKADEPYNKFSPFYPHGNIPVPYKEYVSQSVEGIWQGLKVFENHGIDINKFSIKNMKNLKRTSRKYGKVIGHMYEKEEILNYITARKNIYIPTYEYVLEKYLKEEIKELLKYDKIVLLDYDTNEDVNNINKPLSHASIIKRYILSKKL
ncbi:MAG: hypothetical protein EBU66_14515 [Bacteroidetes bacterium]|nr:hypothetical protein [bacterium]NBP65860.1 hypothetical protein [Bacteroidota bacterium]